MFTAFIPPAPLRYKFSMAAGTFDISCTIPNKLWIFPDGTTSTDDRPTRTIPAGDVFLVFNNVGCAYHSSGEIRTKSSQDKILLKLEDMPPIGKLVINGCTNMTGDLSDLVVRPRTTLSMYLGYNITGDLANIGTVTNYLHLGKTGVHGVLPTTVTATHIYLSHTSITQSDVDQTLINVDAAGTSGVVLDLQGTHPPTAASLAARNSLIAKGWSLLLDEQKTKFVLNNTSSASIVITGQYSKTLTVDWGDGNIEDFTLTGGSDIIEHTYVSNDFWTILCSGEGVPTITKININGTNLIYLNIDANPALVELNCTGSSSLSSVTINEHLRALVLFGLNNGFYRSYQAPTGQGVTDKATLLSRGWTITN